MSDDLARPTFQPFEIEAEYVWVECELPRYQGFKCEVRMNLTNRERKKLNGVLDDINAERERITENSKTRGADIDARRKAAEESGDTDELARLTEARVSLIEQASAALDANVIRIHASIAPYVRSWNVMTRNERGELVDAPPPMIAGVDAFDDIDQKMTGWLVGAILGAYRGGNGFAGSSLTPDEPAEPASGSSETTSNEKPPSSNPDQSQPSPANSRSRSRSTSRT